MENSPHLPISVVITVYNEACYLREALRSVLSQVVMPAEILVIDDGSDDDEARQVVEENKKTAVTLRYYKKENGGPSSARNSGISRSAQPYIAFLDADDKMLPGNLCYKYSMIRDLGSQYFGVYGSYIREDNNQIVAFKEIDGMPSTRYIGRDDGVPGGMGNYLFRRDPLIEVGGLDEALSHNEDFDLLIRLLKSGYACKGNAEPGFIRNYRPGSLTRSTKHYEIYHAVSMFLNKAEKNTYFDELELRRRRKGNCLRLARRLFSERFSWAEVKPVLVEAFSHDRPRSPREFIAYLLARMI